MSQEDIKAVKQRFNIRGNGLNIEIERALIAAKTNSPVLIQGQSGSGKEVFPKIIHYYSNRKNKNFIAINCGSIPEGTIDSELFGHEKGSFTGAVAERKGYFEECDGGTIFLDEIGEMPLSTQARLLRVLESGEFIRVGSSKVIKTNVRIVAATNVNVEEAVRNGKFREDLYYRINTIPIIIKPLCQRRDDIPVLLNYFVAQFAEKNNISAAELVKFDSSAIEHLRNSDWPGNVRQLKNFAEQVALFEMGKTLSSSDLEQYVPKGNMSLQRIPHEDNILNSELIKFKFNELDSRIKTLEGIYAQILSRLGNGQINKVEAVEMSIPTPVETAPVQTIIETEATEISEYESLDEPYMIDTNKTLRSQKDELIRATLKKNGYNKRKTAQELGISERQLYRIIKTWEQ